uniref:Uncharacterized protein n=1 Tax=Thuretia quercifolia TaxID=189650 RepID=A0A1Z1MJX0_9FLOR|nr:hypothetical protein [Thuretia quercifolia]ARW66343.1 hypothetical protein [Thuretia quercifolia]
MQLKLLENKIIEKQENNIVDKINVFKIYNKMKIFHLGKLIKHFE